MKKHHAADLQEREATEREISPKRTGAVVEHDVEEAFTWGPVLVANQLAAILDTKAPKIPTCGRDPRRISVETCERRPGWDRLRDYLGAPADAKLKDRSRVAGVTLQERSVLAAEISNVFFRAYPVNAHGQPGFLQQEAEHSAADSSASPSAGICM
jgi:hypothetical protein